MAGVRISSVFSWWPYPWDFRVDDRLRNPTSVTKSWKNIVVVAEIK